MRLGSFGYGVALRGSTALTGVSRPSRPVPLLASAAFAVLCGLAVPAAAQPVWIGPGTDFNTGSNWSTGIVPDGGGAIFQNTGPTSVFTSVNTTFDGITFAAGAPTYTLTLGDFAQFSADVVNNSGVEQIIVVPTGQTLFMQGSTATGTNVTYQLVGQMSLENISPGGESRYVITSRLVLRGDARSTTLGALSGTGLLQSLTDNDITARIGGLNTNDTFSGQIVQSQAGAILLEKVGTGTLTLAGLNLHTGGTTITAGTLQVGDGGTTGTLGNGAVVNNAALVFNRSDVHLVGNLISGGGTLAQEGTGTLVLTGANTYSGTTTITAGTLQIGDGGTIGTLGSAAVVNNGALVFNRSDAVTVGNLISGGGTLTQEGTGVLTLTGANTYSGGTIINAGTLALGDLGALGAGLVTINAGTLRSDVTGTLANNIGTGTSGTQTIAAASGQDLTLGGNLIVNGPVTLAFGSATEAGTVTLGLSGASGLDTAALLVAGGTLRTGNLTGAAFLSSFGTTTINAGATLDYDTTLGTELVITNLLGSGTLTNNGLTVILRGDFAGEIAGTMRLEKITAGTLILTGTNSYSGGTTITAGTLQVGDGGTTGTLGSGAVVNNAALVFNRSDAVTVGNLISGSGTLTQEGSGTLILTGANTYSGGTTITTGTLQVGAGGTTGALGSGAVVNNAALVFNRSDAVTFGSAISGGGTLTQDGAGTLILTGANTYSGGTTIQTGTLQVGAGGTTGTLGSGAVVNNAALVFNRSDVHVVGNLISGGGTLAQEGTGTLVLTGANTYSGITTITAGTLQVGAGGTGGTLGSAAVLNNGALVFNRSDAVTFGQVISGSGTLTQSGAGTLILTGANSYSGGTIINAGTLQVGNGGTLGSGAVVNNTALVFNHSDAVTVDNLISGSGTLTQAGSGHLILNTAQTYTGATLVRSGRLSVNGSIAASAGVTVEAGGTLGGTGTLPGVAVLAGGAIAPGNSIGTLTISGDLALAPGSITQIEVDGPLADRINVSGTATLGGTLQLVALGGSYSFNAPYTLIQAGAVAGSFATVDTQGSFGAGVTSTVTTTATEAQLVLTPAMLEPIITDPPPPPPPPAPPGVPVPILGQGTPNQIAVARGFDRAVTGGADVSAFFPLYNLPAAQLPRGLDQVSGQVHAVAAGLHAQGAGQFLGAILDPARNAQALGDGAAGSTPRYAVWATALAGNQRMEAGGNATNFVSSTSGGVAAGADVRLSAQVLAGFALAATGATARLSDGLGRADGTQLQGAVYGTGQFGPLRLAAALAYGATELSTERQVPFFGAGQLRGDVTSQGVSTRLEAGWRVADVLPGVALTPQLAFQGSWYTVPNYSERATGGQGPAALAVAGQTHGQSRLEVAVRADMSLGTALSGFARVGWAAYLQRNAGMSARFIGLPQAGFTVGGPRPDAHAALVSGGLDWRLSPSTTVTARVDAELSGRSHAVNGTARIRYAF